MSFREFVDSDGRSWEVWDVRPVAIERRLNDDRRLQPRFSEDRRRAELQFRMHGTLREGWLTFQSGSDKRRVSPIPEGWQELPEAGLVVLLALAVPQRRSLPGSVLPPASDVIPTDGSSSSDLVS
jgi:hypothetical protein